MVYTGYELSGYSADNDSDTWKVEKFERSRNKPEQPFKEQQNTHYKTVKTEPIHPDNANKVFDEMVIDPLLGKTQIGIADPEVEPKPQRLRTEYATYDKTRDNIPSYDPKRGDKEVRAPKSPRIDKKNYKSK